MTTQGMRSHGGRGGHGGFGGHKSIFSASGMAQLVTIHLHVPNPWRMLNRC